MRTPLKFDEFGSIPCPEERARVDNYGKALQAQTQGLAVIIIYAGRSDTRLGEVSARLFGIRDRLKTASAIDQDRILILDGGFREKLEIQLWILPADAREGASVLIDSQIAAKEIHLKSPGIERWQYQCHGAH